MRFVAGTTQQVGWGLAIVVLANAIYLDIAFSGSSASVKCSDGKTYTASVTGGTCTTTTGQAQCTNGAGDAAVISCGSNGGSCVNVGANSKCSQARKMGPSRGTMAPAKAKQITSRTTLNSTQTSVQSRSGKKR